MFVYFMPIGLTHTPTRCCVLPVAGVKFGIGRRLDPSCDSEQRSEGIERVETSIEAEGELVEVGLQVLGADTVMGAVEPGFQVAEDEVDHGHELFGDLGITAFGNGVMVIAELSEAAIAAPVIADDQCARHDGALHEPAQRVGATVRRDSQPDSPSVPTILALILRSAGLAVADFDGAGHKRFVMYPTPFSACLAADPDFIDLHMVRRLPPNFVLVRSNHGGSKLVKNSKCRFVALQVELPLQLDSRYARSLADCQIGCPEPRAQGTVTALHDGANQQAGLATAGTASQYPRPSGEAEGLSDNAAIRANEAIRPAGSLKVGGARGIIGKQPLEFGERLGKRHVSPLFDIRQLRRRHVHPGSPFPTRCWDVQQLSGKYYI